MENKTGMKIKLKAVFHLYDGLIKASMALNLTRASRKSETKGFFFLLFFFNSVGVTLAIIAPV